MKKFRYILFSGILIILALAFLNKETTRKIGINYELFEYEIPIYLKIFDFYNRHYNYKYLAKNIVNNSNDKKDTIINTTRWIHQNIKQIPPGVDGVVEIFAEKGPGLYSNKIQINLNEFEIEPITFDIDDPNFIPVMGSYAPYVYDNLGATQVESNFSPIDRIEDLAKVRAYKFYINGKCIGQQRAWNIIEDPELLNTIYPLGYVVLTQLPPESNLNYE